MKRMCLTAVLALGSLTAASALAQAPDAQAARAEHRHQHRMHDPHKAAMHVGKKLGLSQDQTAKLEPIFAQRRDQAMSIRQNTSLTPEQQKAQLRNLHRNTRQQLANVLTPEQLNQWKSMRHGHHKKGAAAEQGVSPTGA